MVKKSFRSKKQTVFGTVFSGIQKICITQLLETSFVFFLLMYIKQVH